MRFITLCILSLLIALQFRLWSGDNGVSELRSLQQDIERQQATNKQLTQRNQLLQADITDLRNAQEAVEERARNELGLVKPNETFFRLVRLQPEAL
ncbi:MAG: cell division protein FtsB [Firmicutes bacterium]|nr:cell division protein FtsB [Bacillota bacterium]